MNNTHHHSTRVTLKPARHTNLKQYYPHINLLIQLTILLTLLTLLAYTQPLPIELYTLGTT